METKKRSFADLPYVTIDPDLKSSRDSPFVMKKVEAAKKRLVNVDLSILNLPNKS